MSDPIPAEAVYEVSTPTDLAVSPDGARVAVVVSEHDGEAERARSSLLVVPTDGSRQPHRLARASEASQPAWSPDGSRLGFVAARDRDLERTIGSPPEGEEENDGQADDESDHGNGEEHDESGDDEPKPQLWMFDLERGGDAIQLTDREEGVRAFDWGPDGERVVISARDPTDEEQEQLEQRREDGPIEIERLQHKAEGAGWTDSVTTYLFVVDVESGETRRLDDAYGAGSQEPIVGLQPAWNPDGDQIAFVSNRTDQPDDSAAMDVYTVDPAGGDARRLTDGDIVASDLEWSPDGSRLAFASWPADNWYAPREVYVLDREGNYASVSAGLDRTVSWFGVPVWLDEETLLAGIADEGWVRPYRFDAPAGVAADAGSDAGTAVTVAEPEPCLGAFDRTRSVRLLDVADGRVVCSVDDPASGHDLYAVSKSELTATFDEVAVRLTQLNGRFFEDHLPAEFHRVITEHDDRNGDGGSTTGDGGSTAGDGSSAAGAGGPGTDADEPVAVESMVYTPSDFDPGDPEPRPTILWPHGGPMSYDDPAFSFVTNYFTSRGYVVVRPNYRGSTSYGRDFCETLRGRWGTVEVVDQLAALDALVDRGWADPDRLFATGFSYGGISTGFLVTETDRFAAAAPEHGIYDRRSSFATSDSHVWTSNELGVPWEEPEAFEANSSITAVDQIETPLLITAGENDWRCPPTQAEQLYVSVRKQGVPAKLVVYQEEGHDVGDPDRAIHRLEALEGWFDRFDPATPDPEDD